MENLDQKIERYLLGELPQEDMVAFEKALETDDHLAQSLVKHRELLKRLGALRMRKKVKKALGDSNNTSGKGIKPGVIGIIIATILTLAGGFWWYQQKPAPAVQEIPDPSSSLQQPTEVAEQPEVSAPIVVLPAIEPVQPSNPNQLRQLALARRYYQSPTTTFIRDAATSKNPADAQTALSLAAIAFEKGYFATSAKLLLPDSTVAQDETARFLRANSRFKTGQYKGAAADFEALHDSFQFKHDARWNFLLCQLALGNIEAVQALLLNMKTAQDSPFYKYAVELASKLNF